MLSFLSNFSPGQLLSRKWKRGNRRRRSFFSFFLAFLSLNNGLAGGKRNLRRRKRRRKPFSSSFPPYFGQTILFPDVSWFEICQIFFFAKMTWLWEVLFFEVFPTTAFKFELTNLRESGPFPLFSFALSTFWWQPPSRQLAAMQLQKSTHYPFPNATPKRKGATVKEKEVRKAHFPFPLKRGMRKKGKFPLPPTFSSLRRCVSHMHCVFPRKKRKERNSKPTVLLNKGPFSFHCVPL